MPDPHTQANLLAELKKAGSDALTFNAPLSLDRARSSIAFIGSSNPKFVVDFGCGTGSYIRLLIELSPTMQGLGLDLDAEVIQKARACCLSQELKDRLVFEIADASQHGGTVDASICIGSAHVFGDAAAMFRRLAEIQPSGVAVVGDGVWMGAPDAWCLSTFGDLPYGAEGLATIAVRYGWKVVEASISSLAEWDEFEFRWNRGVQAVGTDLAHTFAAQRADEYQRYRGILGFAWLHLVREDGL